MNQWDGNWQSAIRGNRNGRLVINGTAIIQISQRNIKAPNKLRYYFLSRGETRGWTLDAKDERRVLGGKSRWMGVGTVKRTYRDRRLIKLVNRF